MEFIPIGHVSLGQPVTHRLRLRNISPIVKSLNEKTLSARSIVFSRSTFSLQFSYSDYYLIYCRFNILNRPSLTPDLQTMSKILQTCVILCVANHTSHVTRHTSHLTHVTRHTSHLTPHTSHLTPHTSHLTPHT